MPGLLQNPAHMPSVAHASNGARLVSPTDQALPLRQIDLTCEAFGGVARTRLLQRFSNEHRTPLELTYTFPLPADGAVSGYEIRAGNRLIKAAWNPVRTPGLTTTRRGLKGARPASSSRSARAFLRSTSGTSRLRPM